MIGLLMSTSGKKNGDDKGVYCEKVDRKVKGAKVN